MFEDFVRSGDLAPDDLVYDVETAEWSPARTVPLVLEIEYEKEAAEEAAARAAEGGVDGETDRAAADEGDEADNDAEEENTSFGLSLAPEEVAAGESGASEASDAGARDDALPIEMPDEPAGDIGLGLELAPVQDVSPQEAAQAFVEKMEAERRDGLDGPEPGTSIGGFHMEDPTTLAALSRAADPPQEAPRREEPPKARIARPTAPPKKGAGRKVAGLLIGIGVVGGAAWGAVQLFGTGAPGVGAEPDDSASLVVTTPPPPPRQPIIGTTEAAVRERAQELLLTATQALLRDLQPVPEVWTTGEYLSAPSAHPDVLTVWTSYLSTIRSMRSSDTARFQAAYEQALDDAVIEGEARSERYARGMAAFAARDSLRVAHFDRVEALATAAIQSHNALIEAEGLIIYDPTGRTGVPSGIGAGTSGRDTDAQLLLDQVLDLLSSTLAADGLGPRQGSNVREWVYDGYLNAVTN